MGKRAILAATLMLLSGPAFAEHGITLEPETPPAAKPAKPPKVQTEVAASSGPQRHAQGYPTEIAVQLVPAAMREVCTTQEWGFGEVRTECRVAPLAERRASPALKGICTIRYGRRSCY